MKKVLIDLSKIKRLYTGLGQVSYYQGIYFTKLAGQYPQLDLTFLLPKDKTVLFPGVKTEPISETRRYLPFIKKRYDIWYANNQDTKYKPNNETYILTVHDLNVLWEKTGWKKEKRIAEIEKKIHRAKVITYISHFSKSQVHRFIKIPQDKTEKVIYNGVEIDKNHISPRPQYIGERPFLFSIGGLREKKNFKVLIDFMRLLPQYDLIIAGENNTRYGEEMKERIRELGMQDRIILPGIISEAEKNYLYKHCEALVYPSLLEGFGLPVIEAMLWGKPVICSDKTSLPEIGGKYAFYWENFDPQYMKEVFDKAMEKFNNDKEFRRSMLEYASKFSWQNNVNQYLQIFSGIN